MPPRLSGRSCRRSRRIEALRNIVVLITVCLYLLFNWGFMQLRIPPVAGGGLPVGEIVLFLYLITINYTGVLGPALADGRDPAARGVVDLRRRPGAVRLRRARHLGVARCGARAGIAVPAGRLRLRRRSPQPRALLRLAAQAAADLGPLWPAVPDPRRDLDAVAAPSSRAPATRCRSSAAWPTPPI